MQIHEALQQMETAIKSGFLAGAILIGVVIIVMLVLEFQRTR